ncbi:MAG: hypothetical protein LBM62_01340 [Mediterranea sp.]|jgi:hypothetical protein|nr:hypothetical protein [Mediterranea sp.]
MKYFRIFLTLALVLVLSSAFSPAKEKGEKEKVVYAFGLAASFNDTVVYMSEPQVLDSVKLQNGFLPNRPLYSNQMQTYVEYELNKPNYTCMIYFSENKGKLIKEANKIKNRFKKDASTVIVSLNSDEFSFKKPEE